MSEFPSVLVITISGIGRKEAMLAVGVVTSISSSVLEMLEQDDRREPSENWEFVSRDSSISMTNSWPKSIPNPCWHSALAGKESRALNFSEYSPSSSEVYVDSFRVDFDSFAQAHSSVFERLNFLRVLLLSLDNRKVGDRGSGGVLGMLSHNGVCERDFGVDGSDGLALDVDSSGW